MPFFLHPPTRLAASLALGFALSLLAFSACASSASSSSDSARTTADSLPISPAKRMAALDYTGPEPHVKSFSIPDSWEARSGSIRLKQGPEGLLDSAVSLARSLGGDSEVRNENWVLLKIPAASFERAFNGLMRLGEVRHYSQQAENVRGDYEKTEARQRAKDSTLVRAQTRADGAVGKKARARALREVKQARAELESLEARKQALRTRMDFARITVRVARPALP